MKKYTKNYFIVFNEQQDAEEFVKMVGGFISDSYREFLCKYCGEYMKNKTIVLIHTSSDFMESLKDLDIKKKRVNGKSVYVKT